MSEQGRSGEIGPIVAALKTMIGSALVTL